MYDSPEAATYRTDIKGWVNSSGQYWNDEHMARWTSCTHMTCSCGKIYEKGRVRCRFCQAKKDMEDYYALPMIEWDGESPVCDYDGNTYFFDHESVMDILFDVLKDAKKNGYEPEAQLVICEPNYLHTLDSEDWCDDLAEDGELPDAVSVALDAFNEVIKAQGPSCWMPGKQRINMEPLWKKLKEDLDEENAAKAKQADQEEASGNS